jgi:hypothetical protein
MFMECLQNKFHISVCSGSLLSVIRKVNIFTRPPYCYVAFYRYNIVTERDCFSNVYWLHHFETLK